MFRLEDTSPESLKKLNDFLNRVWLHMYDDNGKAIRGKAITGDQLADNYATVENVPAIWKGSVYGKNIDSKGVVNAEKLDGKVIDIDTFSGVDGFVLAYSGSTDTFYLKQVAIGGKAVWVQPDVPTTATNGDVWVDTDDYTRYDRLVVATGCGLSPAGPEYIVASGTFLIALHDPTEPGIIKKIYNAGTGIITLQGFINGLDNMYLYPGESVELITNGSEWRY